MNKKGITLIELVVVMVIIAIGAVLLVPNIGAWLPNYRLRSGARDVVSTLRMAQMKAVSTNMPYGVAFDANACQLYRSSGGLISEGAPINLPDRVQFINNTFPPNGALGGRPFAQFNSDSTSSSGGVTLQGARGSRRITLAISTGRVNVN